jgi:hypothetical protein
LFWVYLGYTDHIGYFYRIGGDEVKRWFEPILLIIGVLVIAGLIILVWEFSK